MTIFRIPYSADAEPLGVDGLPQARVLRGRCILPDAGTPPYPCVLMAHGYTSFMDWGFWPRISAILAADGIASIRFNFSGSGIGDDLATMTEPTVFARNSYLHELADLRELRARIADGDFEGIDGNRLGILGHSRGGAMSVLHAAADGRYRAVATWAAMDRILQFTPERLAQWRAVGHLDVMHWTARRRLPLDVATLQAAESAAADLDVLRGCGEVQAPMLVVMGDADRSLPFAVAERMVAAAPAAALCRIPEGDHTFGARHPLREPAPETLRQALEATRAHFRRHLIDATAC